MVPTPQIRRLAALAALVGSMCCMGASAQPRTLTLAEAKDEAVRNHPAYAAAQLRALLAKEAVREARSGFFPAANGYVTAVDAGEDNTRILAGGINNPSVFDRVGEGIAVSQLITDFGRTNSLTSGARNQVRAADEGAEASREQVVLNVVANYLAALQAQAVLDVARQTLSARELTSRQVGALAENKLKSGLDVSFAQVSQEQAELLVQDAEGSLAGSMASLDAALGEQGPGDYVLSDSPPEDRVPGDADTLVADALRQRPDLMNLRYQVEAARSLASAEKDAAYPTLAAVGVVGNSFSHDDRLPDKYAAAGVQLSIPLFQGGAIDSRARQADLRERVAAEALKEAENNAARDVRLALVNTAAAIKRLATTRRLLGHATEMFDLAQARYQAGSSSIVELSDSQLAETSAAIALANAEFDTRIKEALLDYQTGNLR
jgi:outer membrane protein